MVPQGWLFKGQGFTVCISAQYKPRYYGRMCLVGGGFICHQMQNPGITWFVRRQSVSFQINLLGISFCCPHSQVVVWNVFLSWKFISGFVEFVSEREGETHIEHNLETWDALGWKGA